MRSSETQGNSAHPLFTVVTPSFNMLPYLKRCVRSVADQGVAAEHIVADAVSRDGTPEWLAAQSGVTAIVEKDSGMYDAVNKGLARARGEIVSYLNCDEQYLPGTLGVVADYFASHPEVDVLFGDALLVDPAGQLLSYRKGYRPRWPYIAASHLYVLSCTMFLRRRVIDEGARFDMGWKDVGDAEFVIRILRGGARAAHVGRYLSVFTMTGANMSAGPNARRETLRLRRSCPSWIRALALPLDVARRVEKVLSGAYTQRFPLSYALYAAPDDERRTEFNVVSSSFRWPTA
ncbi:MAG: glycosyltransferase [Gemmatimonadaceae bacterium]|nr:glycosyltransferase [Gemmatimonadaceae bacterium]